MTTTDDTQPDAPGPTGEGSPPGISEDILKRALGAFRKRYKLTKLDQESKLGGHRPVTSGKSAAGIGIIPPREFPREAWETLARQGKIKDMGGGFYTMP